MILLQVSFISFSVESALSSITVNVLGIGISTLTKKQIKPSNNSVANYLLFYNYFQHPMTMLVFYRVTAKDFY